MPKQRMGFDFLSEPLRSIAYGLDDALVRTLPVSLRIAVANPVLMRYMGFEGDPATATIEEMTPYVIRLDTAIRHLLDSFPNEHKKQAALVYYGVAAGCSGTSVGIRKQKVAEIYNINEKTSVRWRKFEIVPTLAWQFHRTFSGGSTGLWTPGE